MGIKMTWDNILNIFVIIVAPIAAVVIGQILQNRSERRKDKLEIFKVLMMNRVGWSIEAARALNIIDIVFADDKNVRSCWKAYYDKLCIQEPDEMERKQIEAAKDKLLESIAISLGYKNKITWETIQNPYLPRGAQEAITQQQNIQNGLEAIAGIMGDIASQAKANQSAHDVPTNKEDVPHANP